GEGLAHAAPAGRRAVPPALKSAHALQFQGCLRWRGRRTRFDSVEQALPTVDWRLRALDVRLRNALAIFQPQTQIEWQGGSRLRPRLRCGRTVRGLLVGLFIQFS